jgi:L-iditol 2-dehydrogenase
MMNAAVLVEQGSINIQKKEIPIPNDDEGLIKIKHVGICGSDLHYYQHGKIGSQVVKYPMILGHECSGEIVETGSNVKGLKVGDMVAVEPQYACGRCEYCKAGRYNMCPDVFFMATPPNNGAFAEYVTHRYDMVYKIPANMDTIEGALLEPLAIGFNIASQAQAQLGQTVHISGCGCIGIVTLLALKAMGITDISISDVVESRLSFAKNLGAKRTVNVANEDVCKAVNEMTDGKGVDIVIEASGNKSAVAQTVQIIKRGGSIVMVGYSQDDMTGFDFNNLILKEAKIITSRRYKNMYPKTIKAVSEGLVPIKDIVTHKYSFEETDKAMQYAVSNKDKVIKAIIYMED